MAKFEIMNIVRMEDDTMKIQLQFHTGVGDNKKTFNYVAPPEVAENFFKSIGKEVDNLINLGINSLVKDFESHIRDLKNPVVEVVKAKKKVKKTS